MSGSGGHLSKDFFELVKAIGESKSKQEEDRIVSNEVAVLKKRIPEGGISRKKLKELLIRLIYVEMLGHDGSFGYIKAVELCASTNLIQKRVGYLTAALVLSPDHDFRFMLVNQLQRDMASSNQLECWAALTALTKLVTKDMVPAVMSDVLRLLGHKVELVRKKAVMALHRFQQLSPGSVDGLGDKARRCLCDRDPAVMGASVCLLHDLAIANPSKYKDLIPSFVSILKQISEHRLPRDYDYHRMPAPWITVRLLRVLGILGQGDQAASEGCYEMLLDVMRRSDTGINVGYAVMYECVRTVTKIYPNATLLDTAATNIARFIKSDNHNLKYLGITALAEIVKDHPKYAAEHQLAVIECLEDPDETLRRKTLDLLYRMVNPVNIEFIVSKLLSFLADTTDEFLRAELVARITSSAERFAPSNTWYVQTVTRVLEVAGELVQPDAAINLMVLIAEGSGDAETDEELRCESVAHLADLLLTETDEESEAVAMPALLLQIIAWVLGEYGALISQTDMAETCPLNEIIDRLCQVAKRPSVDSDTRAQLITALLKLSAQTGICSSQTASVVETFSRSQSLNVQQRCFEFTALLSQASLMHTVLPVDASCEDLEEDGSLAFLNGFVAQALANGAAPYCPPANDEYDTKEDNSTGDNLKYAAYAAPEKPTTVATVPLQSASSESTMVGLSNTQPFNAMGKKANAIGGSLGAAQGPWGQPKPPAQPSTATVASTPEQPSVVASSPEPVVVSATPQPSEAAVDEPRELSDKEKEAAMLFGGMSGGGASDTSRRSSRRTVKSNTPAKNTLPSQPATTIPSNPTPTSASTPTPAPAPPAPVYEDLLGFDMPSDTSAPPPVQSSTVDVFGLSDLSLQPPATTPAAAVDPFMMAGLGTAPSIDTFTALSPLQMTTPAFGAKWTGLANAETRVTAPTTVYLSPEAFGEIASKKAGLYVIEIISATMEIILSGTTAEGVVVCVHAKILAGSAAVAITARSTDLQMAQRLCDFLAQALVK